MTGRARRRRPRRACDEWRRRRSGSGGRNRSRSSGTWYASDPRSRDAIGREALDRLIARQEDPIGTAKGKAVKDPQRRSQERLPEALADARPRQALTPEKCRPIDDRTAVVHDHHPRSRSTAGEHGAGAAGEGVLRHEDHLAGRGTGDAGRGARDAPRVDPRAGEAERVAERPRQQHRLVVDARGRVLLRHDHDATVGKMPP